MSSNPKRVSFGNAKSMIETLIIDVDTDDISQEERNFYQQNLRSTSELSLRSADKYARQRVSNNTNSWPENQENPFLANGELSRKADYILKHSRISRTDLNIVDPDSLESNITPTPAKTCSSSSDCIVESNQTFSYLNRMVEPTGTSSKDGLLTKNQPLSQSETTDVSKVQDNRKKLNKNGNLPDGESSQHKRNSPKSDTGDEEKTLESVQIGNVSKKTLAICEQSESSVEQIPKKRKRLKCVIQ